METAVATEVGTIVTNAGSVMTFIWGLFADLLGVITSNALIAIPVLLAVLCGCILLALRVARKFGLKGKR